MTNKQKLFCIEYLKDLNSTQAAIRAGYSEDTAHAIGWENLRKPEIKAEIDKHLIEIMDESKEVLKHRLVGELKDIAFGDSGIEILRTKDGEIFDIRISDKLRALELLGKYLKIWIEKHDIEIKGNLGIARKPDLSRLSSDELEVMEKLLEKAEGEE